MRAYNYILTSLAISAISGKVYFEETFDGELGKEWVNSEAKKDLGKFVVSPGQFYADEKASRGLQTSEDARFYAISAPLKETIDNKDKDLVIQFSVKFEQDIDCGGGYIKLAPKFDPKKLDGETPYNVMFGPDVCGSDRKVHAILNYKGENKLTKRYVSVPSDLLTHQYTFAIHPDKTYEILVDNEQKVNGTLLEDWDLLPPKEIEDPEDKKPEDWVEEPTIDDPEDKKPEDWVDGPETIPDSEAVKPEDWNDEDDGEWERPSIPNPEYKGEFKPKTIPNPEYKGEWAPKKIPNPEYKEDDTIGQYTSEYIAFDLWQVKSGTIFDNILITDDLEYAKKFSEKHYVAHKEAEEKALEVEEKRKAAEQEKLDKEKEEEEKAKKVTDEAEAKAEEEEEKEKEKESEEDLDLDLEDEKDEL
ncbi:Calreticulin [Neoconidiobolus thromboides FSU 785]|nr:Calreticulin [Neoconidiobolus thromboides FSU 785]